MAMYSGSALSSNSFLATNSSVVRSSMNRIFRLALAFSLLAAAATAQTSSSAPAESKPADSKPAQASPRKVDHAAAYYHYTLAHLYEEQVTAYGRSELANKAMEEYRLAIEADPSSEFLTSGLAELYVKTGRIRDAVLEAQDILKRDPNNLEAHKLLGRIYLRSLGDMPGGGNGSENGLKLAIEQYEEIVKIEPGNVDDHLLLGRLYRLNNDLQKAENELKIAVKLDPDSEEAVTTLALLYTDEGDTAHALQVLSAVPDTGRSAKLYAALGATYEQRKDYKSAIDAYKHAIRLDRDNLDAIRGLAENLLNDGQIDAALDQYKVIADANPEDAQTYLRISEIYRRQGKYDQALDSLKKAEAMVPDALEVPYNIAVVYEAQGRYDEAVKLLQDLLKKTEKADSSYSQADRNNRGIFVRQQPPGHGDSGYLFERCSGARPAAEGRRARLSRRISPARAPRDRAQAAGRRNPRGRGHQRAGAGHRHRLAGCRGDGGLSGHHRLHVAARRARRTPPERFGRRAGGLQRAPRSVHRRTPRLLLRPLARTCLHQPGQSGDPAGAPEMRCFRAAHSGWRETRRARYHRAVPLPGRSRLPASLRGRLALDLGFLSRRRHQSALRFKR